MLQSGFFIPCLPRGEICSATGAANENPLDVSIPPVRRLGSPNPPAGGGDGCAPLSASPPFPLPECYGDCIYF